MHEAPPVAECYLRLGNWQDARDQVRKDNLLQVRTAAAALRISKEVTARLEQLDQSELQTLLDSSHRDQSYLLWVAACRRYDFIREFAREVVREYYLTLRRQISFSDYDNFYNAKALWHTELDEIVPSTQRKLRQNLFRMLREADLISEQQQIQSVILSPSLAQLIAKRDRDELLVFPASENDIQRWL